MPAMVTGNQMEPRTHLIYAQENPSLYAALILNTCMHCRAPLSPSELIKPEQLPHVDPSKVLIVTTGSQAEPRAQLSLASRSASERLKISPSDLILYSAKVGSAEVVTVTGTCSTLY